MLAGVALVLGADEASGALALGLETALPSGWLAAGCEARPLGRGDTTAAAGSGPPDGRPRANPSAPTTSAAPATARTARRPATGRYRDSRRAGLAWTGRALGISVPFGRGAG